MEFKINHTFTIDNFLDSFEEYLKCYYHTHPALCLEKPSDSPLPKELIDAIPKYIKNAPSFSYGFNYFSDALMNLFNKSNIVTAFHPRYLPAVIHSHSFFEVIYVLSGTCINYSGNQILELSPGDLLIIAPDTPHALSVFTDDCQVINILIRVSIFEEAFGKIFSEQDVLYEFFTRSLYEYKANMLLLSHTKDDPIILLAVLSLFEDQACPYSYQEQMKISYMTMLFNRILTKHAKDTVIFSDRHIDTNHDLALILRYMHQHYQTVTLAELANSFGYSERHMSRILKEYTSNGFQKNIQYIRMQHALEFLEDKHYSLEDIATKVGYSSARNFRDAFKQQFGLSPSEFQKKLESK